MQYLGVFIEWPTKRNCVKMHNIIYNYSQLISIMQIFCVHLRLSVKINFPFFLPFCLKNVSVPEIQWCEQSAQPSISLCDWHIWNSSSLTFLSCHCGVLPWSHLHATQFAYLQEMQIIAREGEGESALGDGGFGCVFGTSQGVLRVICLPSVNTTMYTSLMLFSIQSLTTTWLTVILSNINDEQRETFHGRQACIFLYIIVNYCTHFARGWNSSTARLL